MIGQIGQQICHTGLHQCGVVLLACDCIPSREGDMPIEGAVGMVHGIPSARALQMATAAVRRHYVLPETMGHPVVRAECLQLAYLIQAYGLAPLPPGAHPGLKGAAGQPVACQDDRPHVPGRPRRHLARDARALELSGT